MERLQAAAGCSGGSPPNREADRLMVLAANPLHEPAVDLPNKPQRKRQGLEPIQPIVHGRHIVDDLFHIAEPPVRPLGLEPEHIRQRGLCAFDLRAKDGILPYIHRHEEIRVRKDGCDTVQPAESDVGRGEQASKLTIKQNGRVRREGRRFERDVAVRLG
jgi:hypothetical protein